MLIKNLKLERPIAFIDLETTGLSAGSARIVELTVLKVYPDGTEELKSRVKHIAMDALEGKLPERS